MDTLEWILIPVVIMLVPILVGAVREINRLNRMNKGLEVSLNAILEQTRREDAVKNLAPSVVVNQEREIKEFMQLVADQDNTISRLRVLLKQSQDRNKQQKRGK